MGYILSFFMRNLELGADADHPKVPAAYLTFGQRNAMASIPKDAFQVTPTGQVSTSFPNCATVFSLNLVRAAEIISANPPSIRDKQLAAAVREATGAVAKPRTSKYELELLAARSGAIALPSDGIDLEGKIAIPEAAGRHPAVLFLLPSSIDVDNEIARANKAKFVALAAAGNVVLAITPRPSPPGTDDMKAPLLGPFYLLSMRAGLVGRTLVGLRTDDAIGAVDYLAQRADVDPARISAVASEHMGVVLLHAAVLDRRLRHIAIDHALTSYRSLVDAPLPIGAPEDVIPGVMLRYDLPDLMRALGSRVTATDSLKGTDDLSQSSTPLSSLLRSTP